MKKSKAKAIDPRSRARAIAYDLVPVAHGVPGQQESLWNEGAREIVCGLLMHAQKAQPSMTRGRMIREAVRIVAETPYDEIRKIMADEHPDGAVFMLGQTSKSAASFWAQAVGALRFEVSPF